MNYITLISLCVTTTLVIGITLFVSFTRRGKNMLISATKSKKYVICHLRNPNTEFEEVYKIVPSKDYLTHVGTNGVYDLNPRYASMTWKGRLHFTLNQNDVIPMYPNRTSNTDEILIQVREVETALNNKAYDELFKKQSNTVLLLAGIALVISLSVGVYTLYELSQLKSMVAFLLQSGGK